MCQLLLGTRPVRNGPSQVMEMDPASTASTSRSSTLLSGVQLCNLFFQKQNQEGLTLKCWASPLQIWFTLLFLPFLTLISTQFQCFASNPQNSLGFWKPPISRTLKRDSEMKRPYFEKLILSSTLQAKQLVPSFSLFLTLTLFSLSVVVNCMLIMVLIP